MLDLKQINFITNRKPVCIAGPCSAESEEQMIETAKAIKNLGLGVFRAGIWKPRTDPNSFQGIGEKALTWLSSVKKETGLLTATEVATPLHVELALKHNVDILWIGARTTTNPFAVQEIADSLKGVDMPILVKNPINPDIDLWIGALQRLNKVGIKHLAAVLRGFSVYQNSYYRNEPKWHIPIELRRRIPNLPIICDPSHIAGKRELIQSLSQQAIDLQFDGLMIESHIKPQCALSDAKQQISPDELNQILKTINIEQNSSNKEVNKEKIDLDDLRLQIDYLDNMIFESLSKRMNIVHRIGEYKIKNNISLLQMDRYSKMLDLYMKNAEHLNLNPDFIKHMFEIIHEESLHKQLSIKKSDL